MHRSELRRGHVIRIGHHAAVILQVKENGAEVGDDHGYEWFHDLPEEVLRSGYAGEGVYAHLSLDDQDEHRTDEDIELTRHGQRWQNFRGLYLQSFVEVELDRIDTVLDAEGDN